MTTVALLVDVADAALAEAAAGLADYLRHCGLMVGRQLTPGAVTVVVADRPPDDSLLERLLGATGTGSLLLAGPTLHAFRDKAALTDVLGVLPGARMREHEVRLRPGPAGGVLCARMGPEVLFTDRWVQLDKVADDVAVLLTASAGLSQHPVLTSRRTVGGGCVGVLTVGERAGTVASPAYRRWVHRWVSAAVGATEDPSVRVGMLGYGAVGVEHVTALRQVDGLQLAGVCDLDPDRVAAIRIVAPEVAVYDDAATLLDSRELDLIIVSTPPSSHADWALRALERGKSVVVEKPLCLTLAEADDMIETAEARGLVLACYQNRRWDSDYLALKHAVRSGAVGQVFSYSSFVGDYGHPCNYWHSDAAVSGGAVYDWGSHFLDWTLDLLPQDIDYVTAHENKLVWHDVTNADHTRVTVHFADGAEAEFVHSDLAAAPKPKWHLLGTRGALVGSWRRSSVLSRDAVGCLAEDRLQLAESPAAVTLHSADGAVTALAMPPRPTMPFHTELADLLLTGEPMSVTPQGSRRCVAVMAAATASIRLGGRPVVP